MKTLQQIGESIPGDGDKHKHHFQGTTHLQRYEQYLSEFREEECNILEIGVSAGHSVKMWEEYFPNATVYGVDVQPACARHNTTKIKIGSQIDDNFMESIGEEAGNFKFIIDDGSHVGSHIIQTLKTMWKYLEPGGYYIFEDTLVTRTVNPLKRWPGYREGGFVDIPEEEYEEDDSDNYNIGKSRHVVDEFIMEALAQMDGNIYTLKDFNSSPLGDYPIESIHFYSNIQIIRKARKI